MANKKTPKVSVIILNLDGLAFLKKCISTVKSQTYKNIEIIVVDNNSHDGSQKYIKRHRDIILLQNNDNFGYAKANNLGVELSSGEYVFILNNDTELNSTTIENLVSCYENKCILAPLQLPLDPKDHRRVLSCGNGVDFFGYAYDTNADPNKVFFADGAAIFIKKTDFLKLGGFDEELFIFQEDIDLSWRAQLFGFKIKQCKKSILYHLGGGHEQFGVSEGYYVTSKFRRFHNEKNVIRNLLKNYSLPILIPILTLLLVIHLFEIIYLIFTRNFKIIKCYLDAYRWNLKNIGNTLKFRHEIQSKRTISDLQILRRMQPSYYKLIALFRYGRPHFR
jgi:GT2 family glycosyltransferase